MVDINVYIKTGIYLSIIKFKKPFENIKHFKANKNKSKQNLKEVKNKNKTFLMCNFNNFNKPFC